VSRGKVAKILPAEMKAADSLPLTDLGNAERFARQHGDSARYVEGLGWHAWDATRWCLDGSRHVERLAHETVRALTAEANVVRDSDGARWRELLRHAMRSEDMTRVRAMLAMAESLACFHVQADELDRQPELLNVENGTVNLRTGEMYRHDRRDLISKLAPVHFDPTEKAPTWDKLLRWAFLERDDLIAYFQRCVGYALTASTQEHVFFLLHGNGGNGKTTVLDALEGILGDYCTRVPASAFLGGQDQERGLASAAGSRLVLAVEPETGRAFRDGLIKTVTGERKFTARRLYENAVTLPLTFKIAIAANHLPEVRDDSDGFWRRVRLIPFENVIRAEEKDTRLGDRLRDEYPGILAWAIRGAVRYFELGLGSAPEADAATQAYREEESTIRRFVEDRCDLDPEAWVLTAPLYAEFKTWAERNGEQRVPRRSDFRARALRLDGVRARDKDIGRGLAGIKLRG
jgi:putative DNA primase/helicase